MKKIAVFFRLPEPMGHPFTIPDYWTSYSELTTVAAEHGAQLYIVRTQESYKGNGTFSNSWMIADNKLQETGEVTVDVIFNKGRFQSDNTVPVFNCQEVVDMCLDKWKMYTELKDLCPLTFLVHNYAELTEAMKNLTTEKIVFKPQKGGEGVGVKIEEKSFFPEHQDSLQFPAVVSEFLDTSVGVPGIVDGLHDLRLAIFDGEVLYSYYRTPPQGSFLANVSKGGRFEMIDPPRLPSEVVQIAKQIDATLTSCKHRFYSIDFGYTKNGPKIIEMNSELGLLPNKDHPVFKVLKEKIVTSLLDM